MTDTPANPLNADAYGRDSVDLEQSTTLFQGFFRMLQYRLRHKLFKGGWSEVIQRELFQRGDAGAAILYDPVNDLVGLVEQFRVGALDSEYGPWCLEVVAGMLEAGEQAEELIRREISEEAGISAVDLEFIGAYYSTPGGCSERIHLYCATCDLSAAGGVYGLPEEGEDIRFQTYKPELVFKHMYAARTNNAATLIGLQWLQLHRARLRAEVLA